MAVVVAHYGPDADAREALSRTLASIARLDPPCEVVVAVADDGSAWTASLAVEPDALRVLNRSEIAREPALRDLDVDIWVAGGPTDRFRKAELCNAAVRASGADLLVFLDDDVELVRRDALVRLARYLDRYDFVFGRVQYKEGVFGGFRDTRVDGKNIAMRRSLFDAIGGFGEHTAIWGHGVDTDLFWRVYREIASTPGGATKAVYAGDVRTSRDARARRRKHLAAEESFVADFMRRYGVHPRDNPSRRKWEWMDHSSRVPTLAEARYAVLSRATRSVDRQRARAMRVIGRSTPG